MNLETVKNWLPVLAIAAMFIADWNLRGYKQERIEQQSITNHQDIRKLRDQQVKLETIQKFHRGRDAHPAAQKELRFLHDSIIELKTSYFRIQKDLDYIKSILNKRVKSNNGKNVGEL